MALLIRFVKTLAVLFIAGGLSPSLQALPYFKIEKQGRVSYLLGTEHSVPLAEITASILQTVRFSRVVLVEDLWTSEDAETRMQGIAQASAESAQDIRKIFDLTDWLKLKKLVAKAHRSIQDLRDLSFERFYFELFDILQQKYLQATKAALDTLAEQIRERSKQGAEHVQALMIEQEKNVMLRETNSVSMDEGIAAMALAHKISVQPLDSEHPYDIVHKIFDNSTFRQYLRAELRNTQPLAQKLEFYKANPHVLEYDLAGRPISAYLEWDLNSSYPPLVVDPSMLYDPVWIYGLNRHEKWIAMLVRELEQGNVFVAVGLGHIAGMIGNFNPRAPTLLEELNKHGFKVTFVGESCEGLLE